MVDPKSELTRVMEKYNAAFFSKDRTNSSTSIYKESLNNIDPEKVLDIFQNYKFNSQLKEESTTFLFDSEESPSPTVFTISGGRLSFIQERCKDELTQLKHEFTRLKNSRSQTPTP